MGKFQLKPRTNYFARGTIVQRNSVMFDKGSNTEVCDGEYNSEREATEGTGQVHRSPNIHI